jgi:hypothetical protein
MPEEAEAISDDVRDYNKAVGLMSQHLVALCCDYDTVESDGSISHQDTMVFSGWLLELHGQCYWVTAGHCLKEQLDDHIKKGHIRVTGGGFIDYLGYKAQHFFSLPFTYEIGCGVYILDFPMGLDFALVPVDDLKRRGFQVNNNIPVTRDNWVHQARLSFDFYRMLGIPEDRVLPTRRHDGTNGVTVQPTMMAIDRIDYDEAKSEVDLLKSNEWFIGRIHPSITTQTVKGMSGGPIFGFRKQPDGRLLYHVVALQSWWDEDKRIVFGCSVPFFAEAVHNLFTSAPPPHLP